MRRDPKRNGSLQTFTTRCASRCKSVWAIVFQASMSDLKVLVVGASIAGPMAAYWLAEAGAEATIIERYPALRSGGQNIDIRTCGVTVVRKIPGLEAALKASLAPLEGE